MAVSWGFVIFYLFSVLNIDMKRFIIKTLWIGCVIAGLFVIFCLFLRYCGFSDFAYKRFTVGKQHSLVIGTSRSAQGIHPAVINDYFSGNSEFSLPIYNFSFTVTDSPYGEVYYNAIRKILNADRERNKKGLFILSVDPWSLLMEDTWDAEGCREKASCVNKIKLTGMNPNFQYLAYYFQLRDMTWVDQTMQLQDDGWLKINFSMANTALVNENVKQKCALYRTYRMTKSLYRLCWLEKTIVLLKQYGDVYMCRMPVHVEMLEIENANWGNFEEDIRKISSFHGVPYISFVYEVDKYRTIDGNHLCKDDGALFTKNLCDSIKTYYNGIY